MLHNKICFAVIGSLVLLILAFCFLGVSFGANVSDNNTGNAGYIFISAGGHVGHWTDITTIPALKGAKGDKGDTGAIGQAGKDGYTPIKGVDYFDGKNGTNGKDGINGLDGKDVDPSTLINLKNTDTELQNNINTEQLDRVKMGNDLTTGINSETTQRITADNKLQNNINSVNSRVDDVNNRVSKLERTQYVLETSFRVLDTKRISLRPFFRENFTRNKIDIVGLKIDIKLGQSYEEKLINKVNARLDLLEKIIGNAPIITKVVDMKGKTKSISISQGQLTINGGF